MHLVGGGLESKSCHIPVPRRGGGAGGLAFDELQCNQNYENAADEETHNVCCDIVRIHRNAPFKY